MTEKKRISDQLKKNLPQFQRDNKNLDEFLEAAGDFLEKIKEGIEAFDYQKDYDTARLQNVEFFTEEMGIDLPRALPENIKRKILRDISELNIKQGTNDDLEHTLRLIGFSAEVRNAWIQAPRELRKGYLQDVVTRQKTRYDIGGYVYTDFLYGKEAVKDNGTFFEGYRFSDGLQEQKIENIPILGEQYDERPENLVPVSKTPYIIVRFSEGDFNVNTGSYVDPDTGEVYEYTFQEEFDLVNEIIRYFTRTGRRPTNLRIVVVVTLQSVDDEMGDYEDVFFDQTTTYNDDGGDNHDELITPIETPLRESSVEIETSVGNKYLSIGEEVPYSDPLIVIASPVIGSEDVIVDQLLTWSLIQNSQTVYLEESYPFIPIRALTDITFNAPTETDIEIYATNKHEDPFNETLINTVNAGQSFSYSFSDNEWGFFKLRPTVPDVVDGVLVNVTMNSYDQENL